MTSKHAEFGALHHMRPDPSSPWSFSADFPEGLAAIKQKKALC
jgi:hypothetical protein